jgi:hypothetical protein
MEEPAKALQSNAVPTTLKIRDEALMRSLPQFEKNPISINYETATNKE